MILAAVCVLTLSASALAAGNAPRIVNIINFIRQTEPRTYTGITDEMMYDTVVKQIEILDKYDLKGTFLLQYDALENPLYQELLKNGVPEGTEIGGWWEITQPHAEAAGIEWRGRFSWDWFAEVDFSIGYTPAEREKLVDVYMEKFKSIFGYWPKSVGSWFIDAYTLNYMHRKYGIVASCNCKDQYGTDGYTLWGGYWNQAYYPSRVNAYMPAQDVEDQIPVPVFRMLGSDPIYQYDNGLDTHFQTVVTLEPACGKNEGGGSSEEWIKWFLNTMAEGECLNFNYLQAGQENSFIWDRVSEGYELQMPLIKKMADEGRLQVKTLAESGQWFKKKFKTTPATAVTAMEDWRGLGHKSVWYDSRYYRANLFWEGESFRFRDIHMFDEDMRSEYMDNVVRSNKFVYSTLPVVDGFVWSTSDCHAGLRFVEMDKDGAATDVTFADASCKGHGNTYRVRLDSSAGTFVIRLKEDRIIVSRRGFFGRSWGLELGVDPDAVLPFKEIDEDEISATHCGFDYDIELDAGRFEAGWSVKNPWRIRPVLRKRLVLKFD